MKRTTRRSTRRSTGRMNPKALRKARQAADLLERAARLMREAAEMSEEVIASGRYDFASWARAVEELLSCDDGEAGIRPTLAIMTKENQ
ncbi:MAG: hypothetical protein GF355_16980 [Candidatus Eisenbacteria bacterium]|nr:hypothetical protein [Candidatus Eisenbacteria bacterium]